MYRRFWLLILITALVSIWLPNRLLSQDLFEFFETLEDSSGDAMPGEESVSADGDSLFDDFLIEDSAEQQDSERDTTGIMSNINFGVNIGGQLFNGDVEWTKVGWSEAFEIYLKMPLADRFFISPAIGFGSLSDGTFHVDKSNFYTSMYTFDLRLGSNLIKLENKFNTFFYLGLGLIQFKYDRSGLPEMNTRESATTIFSGGGIEYQLKPNISLSFQGDYRFANSDLLEGLDNPGTAKDGYGNFRVGLNYHFGKKSETIDDMVLAELITIDQSEMEQDSSTAIDDFGDFSEGLDQAEQQEKENRQVDQLVKLKVRVEKLNDLIRQKEALIDELKAQLESRAKRLVKLKTETEQQGGQTVSYDYGAAEAQPANPVQYDADFNSGYEEALRMYYEQDYAQCISIFNNLLQRYPNHKLASNCQYWIGESYYCMQDYQNAIQSFQTIFSYNESSKYDDSLLMLARCNMVLGDSATAHQFLQQLINDYPESEYVATAHSYLNN